MTAAERSSVIATVSKAMKAHLYYAGECKDEFLIIDLKPFAKGAEDRHAKLAAARKAVVEDPEILSGTPVFKGTRVPVRDVAASVKRALTQTRHALHWRRWRCRRSNALRHRRIEDRGCGLRRLRDAIVGKATEDGVKLVRRQFGAAVEPPG